MTRRSVDAAGVNQLVLDGAELTVKTVPLVDDQHEHYVEVNA